NLRFGNRSASEDGNDNEDPFLGFSAVSEACSGGHVAILERLGPDPARDDFEELYRWARNGQIVAVLSRYAHPNDVGAVIHSRLMRIRAGFRDWESLDALRRLFEVGVRWKESSGETIAAVRWTLVKLPDQSFVDVVKLLATGDHSVPEILKELGRT